MPDEIEKLREELAEANARIADFRTALGWSSDERDRLREQLANVQEAAAHVEDERDRLREQLAAKHSECPDCADYAARSGRFAEQADRLQRERDEARAEVNAIQKENLELREKLEWQAACTKALMESQERLAAELKEAKECEARADVERLRGVLHVMSLDEYESTTSASDKVHAHARRAREALAATAASDGQSDKAHIASLEDLFLKACIRADKHKKEAADAFHRGAEAMRLACQQWCRAWENNGKAIADALADLKVEDER